MSVGMKVLSSTLRDREAYLALKDNMDEKGLPPDVEFLMGLASHYYEKDPEANHIDVDLFKEQVVAKFPNPNKAEHLTAIIDQAHASTFSIANYIDLCIETRKQAIGHRLAAMLSSSDVDPEAVAQLMGSYTKLDEISVEEVEDNVIHNMSVEDAINKVLDKSGRMYLAPKALNDATDGCMEGDALILIARPEAGKTALCLTIAAGFAMRGHPGLYFSNEEPTERLAARYQSTVTGMTAEEIMAQPDKATSLLQRRGYENVRFIRLQYSTPAEIEKYVKMYKPKWFIVDQLRNMKINKIENKTQVLEESAKALRHIGGTHKAVSIGVTQAGDSGEGKARLTQGDIDGSNTGIPGACDLIIGVGVTEEMEQQNTRLVYLSKNKLSGKHVAFPLRINPFISRMENI